VYRRLLESEGVVLAKSRWVLLLCACAAAVAIVWPSEAYAQRRGRVYRYRPSIVVSAGFHYWPSYGYYYPAFGPYYGGWYPYPYGFYPPYYYAYDYLSSARVQVTPRDAQVYVDGYFAGMVDDFDGIFQRLRLDPGEHDLQLYREGYRTISEKILFRPGQTYRIRYVMEPLPAGAPPEPRPRPAAGAAPVQRRGYPPGARQLPPSGPEYPPSAGQRPEGPPSDRGDLSSTFGTISIRVQPADATIVVDGERWEGPQGGSRLIIQVPEGSHRIEIRKDGFKDFTRTIDVRRGETATLNVSLVSENRP
jgi:hypothetical protein